MGLKKNIMTEKEIEQWVIVCRGEVVHECTKIEVMLNCIITSFFSNEKTMHEFSSVILGNQSFNLDFKYKVLKYICENNIKGFKNKYPKFLNELKKCIELRNEFAHKFLTAFEDNPTLVSLKTHENKIAVVKTTVSKKEMDKYRNLFNSVLGVLITLYKAFEEFKKKADEGESHPPTTSANVI